MFVGWPQPLWWYAAHNSQNSIGKKLSLTLLITQYIHCIQYHSMKLLNFIPKILLAQIMNGLPDSDITQVRLKNS